MVRYFGLFLLIVVLVGCQASVGSYYLGALADRDAAIRLDAAQSRGRWQDLYLVVDYRYRQEAGKLQVQGTFRFAEHPLSNMRTVHDFKLNCYLLDEERRVLAYQLAGRTTSGSLRDTSAFQAEFPFSEQVAAIAFGYEGELHGEVGSGIDFVRRQPRVNP